MNHTHNAWCIQHRVMCSQSSPQVLRQRAFSSGCSVCLCHRKCTLCILPEGSSMRTMRCLQPPQVLWEPKPGHHTACRKLCSAEAKPCSHILFLYRGVKPYPPFCYDWPWHPADNSTPHRGELQNKHVIITVPALMVLGLLLVSWGAVCVRMCAPGHFPCPFVLLSQPQWHTLKCLFLALLLLRRKKYSWRLQFYNWLTSCFSLRGTGGEAGCSPVMWNKYFFSPLPWWLSRLAGLPPKGAQNPAPIPSTGTMEGEGGKREGRRAARPMFAAGELP